MSDPQTQHPAYQRFENTRAEYEAYLPLTQRVQEELKNDAEELRAQEDWTKEEWDGLEEWITDRDSIFRHLRRHRFEEEKTITALLSTLQHRISYTLHSPIPAFPPYTDSALFYVLPLPEHTDRLGRPIAVLTVKEVIRDSDGKLDDLKLYAWWALEMIRRVLRDYWVRGNWSKNTNFGKGGEGLCVLVDANGAGYRNMEVELLPTLLSVGHNHFPGMIESVYVVNTGWTHRSMWNVVKRILPRSALEKVAFLDDKPSLEAVFDLDKLPQEYGGNNSYTFSPAHNTIYSYYSHHSSTDHPFLASRNSSYSSIADIYYTVPNTPARSRRNSSAANLGEWKFGSALRMTKSREAGTPLGTDHNESEDEVEVQNTPEAEIQEDTPTNGMTPNMHNLPKSNGDHFNSSTPLVKGKQSRNIRSGSRTPIPISNGQSAIQRIKSISDFHLYLSPSRLAHLNLLSDSDPEDADDSPIQKRPVPTPKRILKPALNESGQDKLLSKRRSRPSLRLLNIKNAEGAKNVRTYSDRLQLHHAKVLQQYTGGDNTPRNLGQNSAVNDTLETNENQQNIIQVENINDIDESGLISPSSTPGALEPPSLGEHYTDSTPGIGNDQVVGEYDSSNNPWFGYPVVKISTGSGRNYHLKPKYTRNRKRDLIKTLLFLFMLRIQSLRNSIERFLGIDLLLNSFSKPIANHIGPQEGLLSSSASSLNGSAIRKSNTERDWWLMIIGFLLLRGTWSKLLVTPLETLVKGKEILGW
ncbi:uncharacterized protein L201_000397 [Kwoniella dendrophila CBS 6074]|uniref:CRAL-TRIO domain-containing protein n=1 Tax=Kwoniella dendrophila CBS 6074 TaxID=1295534 RepID=A0AAX4JKU4_9TREE